jgi:hypothetical protein
VQTFLKSTIIVLLGTLVAVALYVVAQSQFSMSMGPGGFSPGFAWLLKLRALENGGQIAPSFDELGMSGSAPPPMGGGMGGFPGGTAQQAQSTSLTEGMDASKALVVAVRDLFRVSVAILIAILFELSFSFALGLRRQAAAAR